MVRADRSDAALPQAWMDGFSSEERVERDFHVPTCRISRHGQWLLGDEPKLWSLKLPHFSFFFFIFFGPSAPLSIKAQAEAISLSLSLSFLHAAINSSWRGPETSNMLLVSFPSTPPIANRNYLRLRVPTILIIGISTFLQVKKL